MQEKRINLKQTTTMINTNNMAWFSSGIKIYNDIQNIKENNNVSKTHCSCVV